MKLINWLLFQIVVKLRIRHLISNGSVLNLRIGKWYSTICDWFVLVRTHHLHTINKFDRNNRKFVIWFRNCTFKHKTSPFIRKINFKRVSFVAFSGFLCWLNWTSSATSEGMLRAAEKKLLSCKYFTKPLIWLSISKFLP